MKEKKMNIVDLENNLCDDIRIEEMLGSEFDLLRVDELNKSYNRYEDNQLDVDFRSYSKRKEEEFRQECRKRDGY